jgi:plastocyanin
MKTTALLCAIAFCGCCVATFAAERSISQKGRNFSQTSIAIKRGDIVTFVNDDTVTHNVLSTDPGNEFNIGSQTPGVATPVTFDKAGDFTVFCAIHPRMKLQVRVNN